jgi:hypothetical protein
MTDDGAGGGTETETENHASHHYKKHQVPHMIKLGYIIFRVSIKALLHTLDY